MKLATLILGFTLAAFPQTTSKAPKRGAAPPAAPAKAAARPAPLKSAKDLKYPPLKEIRLPEITSFTMANGMKVYLLERHDLPLVSGSVRIRAGNVFDPPSKTGLSDIFGEVLRTGGTKAKTGDELNELLEGIASSVESNIGETSGSVSFSTLTEHTDTVLGIFKDVLTEPQFRQEKIDVIVNQYRSAISRRNEQAGSIASREFARQIYGPDSAWGRQMEYETLSRITRQDLFDFHKRYFFPANMILAVYGDFNTSQMRKKLESLFAGWDAKQQPVPAFPPVSAKPKPGIHFVEKGEVTQTFFRIGHLGGKLSDKDYPALEVMADILGGGGFSSRLLQKVRSDLGYAYSVGASWSAEYSHPGTFFITGSTKAGNTTDTFRVIRDEVEKIRTTEVTDEELQIAKDSTLNSFVFNFDSPAKTLSRLVQYEYHGYPKDFVFQYQKAIAAVTKADVLRVAKQYLKPEEMVYVAVGKSADFGEPLSALSMPIHKLDITIPEPKKEAAKVDSQTLAQGKALIQKLQAAAGGADKLAGVSDYMHTANNSIMSVPGGLKVTQVTKVLGDQVRFEQQLPFGKIIIYSDGKGGGFMIGPQGQAPLPPQAVKQVKEEMFRLHPRLWTSDRDPNRTVNAIGANAIEISDKEGNSIRLYLSESGLPAKAVYSGVGQAGPVDNTAEYEDWKEAGGLKLPGKVKISQNGKVVAEVVIAEYKLNSGLKPEELSQK